MGIYLRIPERQGVLHPIFIRLLEKLEYPVIKASKVEVPIVFRIGFKLADKETSLQSSDIVRNKIQMKATLTWTQAYAISSGVIFVRPAISALFCRVPEVRVPGSANAAFCPKRIMRSIYSREKRNIIIFQ